MALTKFVRNVDDLSDDGGYKFRFKCDRCGDGFESQYIASKSNLLKTAIDLFQVFRPFGFRRASQHIDRGLRGKERDAAYERAAHEAALFFKKCTACGQWSCPESCWNGEFNLCEGCAPNAGEAAAKVSAQLAGAKAVQAVQTNGDTARGLLVCAGCGLPAGAGQFCQACGLPLKPERKCSSCHGPLDPSAKFCGTCGTKQ